MTFLKINFFYEYHQIVIQFGCRVGLIRSSCLKKKTDDILKTHHFRERNFFFLFLRLTKEMKNSCFLSMNRCMVTNY